LERYDIPFVLVMDEKDEEIASMDPEELEKRRIEEIEHLKPMFSRSGDRAWMKELMESAAVVKSRRA